MQLVLGLLALLLASWAGGLTIFYATVIAYLESFQRSYCGPNAYECPPSELLGVAFIVGAGALVYGTHGLAHWVVGRLLGMRFTRVFPGRVEVDHTSYLRVSPRRRAAMHAAGAVVTITVPFLLVGAAIWLYGPFPWLTWLLVASGVASIFANVLFGDDWKKMRRELGRR